MSKTATHTHQTTAPSQTYNSPCPSTSSSSPQRNKRANGPVPGRPREQLRIDDSATNHDQPTSAPANAAITAGDEAQDVDTTVDPGGTKLWLTLGSVLLVALAKGLVCRPLSSVPARAEWR